MYFWDHGPVLTPGDPDVKRTVKSVISFHHWSQDVHGLQMSPQLNQRLSIYKCHTNVCMSTMYLIINNVINDTFLIIKGIDKFIINLIINIYALIPWRQPFATSEKRRDLQKSTQTAKTLAYLMKNISLFIFNSD